MDALGRRSLEERRVGVECGGEERLTRKEQQDHVDRAVDLGHVVTLRQRRDMAGDGLGVLGLEPPLDGGVARIGGVEVPVEGHFGVDHDAAAVGEWHDDIGSRAGLAVGHAPLLDEVGVAVEPRHLEHPTELHLAPRATHAVVAHGSRELGCLGLGGPMGDRQVADDGPQHTRRVVALPFEHDQTLRQRRPSPTALLWPTSTESVVWWRAPYFASASCTSWALCAASASLGE